MEASTGPDDYVIGVHDDPTRIAIEGRRLARHPGDAPVPAATIAEAEHISLKFLEGILSQLRNAGLVASKLGKGGGHLLGKEPAEITLLSVIRTIDGPVAPLACLSHTAYRRCDDCDDEKTCLTRRLLAPVQEAQVAHLGRITLADALGRRGR